jgi:hypothetical protein
MADFIEVPRLGEVPLGKGQGFSLGSIQANP